MTRSFKRRPLDQSAPIAASVPDASPAQVRRDDICVHIFTAVGVCLTVIGLMQFVRRLHGVASIVHTLLSWTWWANLVACVVACAAPMSPGAGRFERYADVAFLLALGLMTEVCGLLALELV
ncbi:MAG: hypothetical protein Q8K55_02235 [Gemmatimonadaceae bacterium]|nr:hypothetical protein [Gemmatimonadaceae bacterium]